MRSGLNNLAIAQDRLRIDCVDLVLHDLQSYAIAGVHSCLPGQWNPARYRLSDSVDDGTIGHDRIDRPR